MTEALFQRLRLLRRMNWLMLAAILGLAALGILFIYSATSMRADVVRGLYRKQLGWALAGLGTYVAAAAFDYRKLRDGAWWFYGVSLVLLVAVLFVGTKIYGARRWLFFLGVGVQPSELAKIAFILLGATRIAVADPAIGRRPSLGRTGLLAAVPMALIFKEPDLGTTLVFVPLVMVLLFVGGAPLRPLLGVTAAGLLAVAAVVAAVALPEALGMSPERQDRFFKTIHMSAYQRERIAVFLDADRNLATTGYNRRQSEIAVGAGGLTGKGFLKGQQNELGFLPRTVAPTDFIFSVIAEELGFVGSCLVLGLYVVLIVGGLYAAMVAPDRFGRLLCAGIVTMVFSHVFINVGMTIGLMPITGLPLPLVSYGGTFMVSTMATLGLIQSVYVRRQGT
jgi:rod shape determining protein RodA